MTSLWTSALDKLSGKVAPQNFELWLRPIVCREITGNRILLRAPNQYVKLWFESNYLPVVLEELKRTRNEDFQVEFEVVEEDADSGSVAGVSPPYIQEPPTQNEAQFEPRQMVQAAPVATNRVIGYLNPKYTFDTFVAGPSNQLAYAAARASASPNPPKYNPLFICGGAGLGKTHLLHAVGHSILAQRPETRVVYFTGERFINEFINSIRTDRMNAFRKKFREDCDVILLDDIQFFGNKDSTQDEFFHTFNALHEQGRQIVLSADRKPIEIPHIADRLRTRFSMGLTADIEPPELEVRVAILRKKAHAEGIPLPDEVSLYIAESIKSNVRELEGALIRLAAYASLSGHEIDIDFARQTLEGIIARPAEHLTVDQVLKTTANYYGVKVGDLKSERRHKSIAGPRAVAMFLARKHTGESYPDLGRAFGNKHHTTVLSACEKITRKLRTEISVRGEVQALESLLGR